MKQSRRAAPPPNAADFIAKTGASADVVEKLEIYADMLGRWQAKINLVGASTLGDIWIRHFLDSAQLAPHLPVNAETLADIGSGAGFPGLVLSLVGGPDGPAVHLIESDARKAAFLREVNREIGAGATIVNARAEAVTGLRADVVTARACAPLPRLLPWVSGLLAADGAALLLKGKQWSDELTAAKKEWTMRTAEIASLTDASGVVLKLEGLTRID